MILDSISNASDYANINEEWGKAFAFLEKCKACFPGVGRHEIDGDRLYASVQEYTSADEEELAWEAHKQYIDIQYIYSGNEIIVYAPIGALQDAGEYQPEKDCILAKKAVESVSLPMHADSFAVFFPQDAHKPKCVLGQKEKIQKIVIKMHI